MIAKALKIVPLLVLCLGGTPPLHAQTPGPESVVVVANSAVPGSLEVAEAYMKRRSIPEEHLITISSSESENINRVKYLEEIHNPVLEALLDRELVNAFKGEKDSLGRLTATVFENPIRYMVLCYGVPLRIPKIPAEELDDLAYRRATLKGSYTDLVEKFSEGLLAKNEASVDGELALILKKEVPLNGFVPNPFFREFQTGKVTDIIKVTRLDGPSPEAVIRMLDQALEGERKGLKGRAYVDEDGREGPYRAGNAWLEGTAELFRHLGFDLHHDTERKTIAADARFDAPVLYAGWYSRHAVGPFQLPGFRFPPGAVAAHLHSYSAAPLRSESKGWVGPMVASGVSATFGNVAEPYLTFTHQFNLFFSALAEGWNFADAAYFALPALSWQPIAVGDPLYRPFAVGIEEQLEQVGDPLTILEDQYVILRKARLLEASGDAEGARRAVERGMRETPGLALGLERARILEEAGEKKKALKSLAFLAQLKPASSVEWGLYGELADRLHRLGDPRAALEIYRSLEKLPLPEPVLLAFLKRGIKVAEDAGEARLAIDWQARVTPPPPTPPAEPENSADPEPPVDDLHGQTEQ